jgi:hypothetical protein
VKRTPIRIARCLALICAVSIGQAFSPAVALAFDIEDYFKLERIKELALSSAGDRVAYVIERASLDEDRQVRSLSIQSIAPLEKPKRVRVLDDAFSIKWSFRTNSLLFLSNRKSITQVFSYSPDTEQVRQLTFAPKQVVDLISLRTKTSWPTQLQRNHQLKLIRRSVSITQHKVSWLIPRPQAYTISWTQIGRPIH